MYIVKHLGKYLSLVSFTPRWVNSRSSATLFISEEDAQRQAPAGATIESA